LIDDGDELGDSEADVETVGGELSGPGERRSAAWRSQANRAIGAMFIMGFQSLSPCERPGDGCLEVMLRKGEYDAGLKPLERQRLYPLLLLIGRGGQSACGAG